MFRKPQKIKRPSPFSMSRAICSRSPDGIKINVYKAGKTYGPTTNPPMPADLATVFLREGWGEICGDEEPVQKVSQLPPVDPEPAAACLWCRATYRRRTTGGSTQRFCATECRSAEPWHHGLLPSGQNP